MDSRRLHWWQLPEKICLETPEDDRTWRDVLDGILDDMGIAESKLVKLKMSINGVIANANGIIKRSDGYCKDAVISACIQRLVSRPELIELVNHEDFNTFIYKKVDSLLIKE